MKVYIIMRMHSDCEGKTYGFPEIYKIFTNKNTAKKELDNLKGSWDYFYMEEKEVEAD
jgi:hypothetical protein